MTAKTNCKSPADAIPPGFFVDGCYPRFSVRK
ncbi:hypothetical protein AGROH133_07498 [Agrobacterium tumefaciens]|nr:hypothetical protein AGROH133_07498 [Agrobacterium tumefaciens]